MNMVIKSGLEEHFNSKEESKRRVLPKNTIFFSKNASVRINTVDGVRWINVGDAGSGKSWKNAIECSQFKNVLFWDPTRKFYQTILMQAEIIENEYGSKIDADKYRNKWKQFILTPEQEPNANGMVPFKMNVNDLNTRCLETIFWKMEESDKATKRRQALHEFLMRKHKTYQDWKQLCEEVKGLASTFKDLDWILSHDDSAPDLEEIVHGASIIDISDISTNNCCVGVFMQCLFGARKELPDSYLFDPEHFVIMALDEAQDYCTNNSPFGVAFSDVNKQARKFGIGEILTGSAYNTLQIDVRTKANMQFIFKSKGMTNKYRGSNLDIMPEEWDLLTKWGCFIFSDDGRFAGPSNGDKTLPSLYYIEEKIKNLVQDYRIKKYNTIFHR
jgi:hypothetical protein